MRTLPAVALFCLTALTGTGRPDDAKVWNWPKEKEFRDGDVAYKVRLLKGAAGDPFWKITWVVTNVSDAPLARKAALARWYGVAVADDTGAKIEPTKSAASPGDLPAGEAAEYELHFAARPGPKAKAVHIDFAPAAGRPALRMTIPAAAIRGLKDKL